MKTPLRLLKDYFKREEKEPLTQNDFVPFKIISIKTSALTLSHCKAQREMIVEDEQVENLTNIFPVPVSREFLLKVMVGRPYHYSQPTQQRFYCCLKEKEFRVAGAFSVDTQFL